MDCTGLDWAGCLTELGWTGWAGLDWAGLDWTGLDWTGLEWAGLFLVTTPAAQPSPAASALALCHRPSVIGLKRVHYFWAGPPSRGTPGRMGASATKNNPREI